MVKFLTNFRVAGNHMSLPLTLPLDLLEQALRFYEGSPDGQYDEVAVRLIEAEIVRRVPGEWRAYQGHIEANLNAGLPVLCFVDWRRSR